MYLLGPPRAECRGSALAVPRRQVRALLFRLAARLQPVSRNHLCFLLWPDVPESTARRNLSRLLPQLRSALPVPQALVTMDDHVWLDAGHMWSDTASFERLCAEREPQRQIDAFAQTIGLYRGPFLDAFSLPGSPEFERSAIRACCRRKLSSAVQLTGHRCGFGRGCTRSGLRWACATVGQRR
jgi:DNA-binding SARP family transcriptional activator